MIFFQYDHHLGINNAKLLLTYEKVKVIFLPLKIAENSTNYLNGSFFLQYENYLSFELNMVFFNVNFLTSYDLCVVVWKYTNESVVFFR